MSWLDDEFDSNELESYMNKKEDFKMTKGMVFDLYQDGKQTVRVMAINERDVICLTNDIGVIIKDIDFENECESILIDDISSFC
jgi:hypothetical protein